MEVILIQDFVDKMKKAKKMLTSFGNEVSEGTLSFKKYIHFFSTKDVRKNSVNFLAIMQFAGMTEKKILERFEQIKIYESLDNIKMIVKVLLEIKVKNKLTEDFSILKDMDESVIILKFLLILNYFTHFTNCKKSCQQMITTTNHSKKSTKKPCVFTVSSKP